VFSVKNDNRTVIIKWFLITVFFLLLLPFSLSCNSSQKQFTVWIGGSPEEINFWDTIVKEFEQEYHYNLRLVRQPSYSDQRRQALVVSLEARQPNPDVFLMDVIWIDQFVKSGWLEPLDNFAKKENFPANKFFKKTIEQTDIYNGVLYALPAFIDVALLYYRTDLLGKYGYTRPPETWQQLLDMSRIIQTGERKINKSFDGFIWQGAQYEGLVCTFLEFSASMGGGIMQGDSININTPANAKALKFMQDLIRKYHVSPENTYTEMKEEEVRRTFQRGDALFERNWTYAWQLHQSDNSAVKGKTGIELLPHSPGDSSVSALGGWHLGISKYSDMKDKAWQFVKFVTSFKIQKQMLMRIGWNPGRKDVYEDKEVLEKMPRVKILEEAFEHTVARPTLPYYLQVSEVIQRYVNNCLAGKETPSDALRTIAAELKQIKKLYEE
jgi:multiple sugar transport system substrate-binding protein